MFSRIAIKRPVTTIMVTLMVILGGVVGLSALKLDLMPSMDIPVAVVSTTYVGAGPSEIESLITEPLEGALGTVSNVKTISSTSSANSSMIIVQFEDGTDIDMASIDMREKVDLIKGSLPEDANEPMVIKMDTEMMSSIMVGVSSDKYDLTELNNILDESIINRIERIEGVASVSTAGGVEKEIEIIVKPEKMQGYGITESTLAQTLAAENLNYPTGSIEQGTTSMQVRTTGEFKSVEEIKNLPVRTPSGAVIHVSDFVDVNEVEKDMSSLALINGEEGIMLTIQKQSTANVVDISEKINKELDVISKDYPDIHISMLSDTAEYITTSIDNIVSTSFQAAIMAIVVLFIFLRDPKTSLIIGISIPTSIVATFGLMYLCGMSMNMISMGGLAIGIGMLVDNSVVVLENIFKYWKNGMTGKRAAQRGASEVGMAITASTLTTVAVFLPLMFVKGTIGQLFKDLSLTITFSLAASLIVSLTFVPMACSKLLGYAEIKAYKKKGNIISRILDVWGKGIDKLDELYHKALIYVLDRKKRVVALFLIIFIGTLSLVPIIGLDFMPAMDQGVANITIELPKGSIIEQTEKEVYNVMEKIEDIPEIDTTYVTVGGGLTSSSVDNASITVNMVPVKDRERSTDEIVEEMKERLSNIAGVEITVEASSSAMGSFGGNPVSIQIQGNDTDTLNDIGDDVMKIMEGISGIKDITSSSEDSVPEANVMINRAKASLYGVTSAQIANSVSNAITGTVSTQYKIDGTEIDIRIRQDKDSVKYLNDLKNIKISTPTGAVIPLNELADINIKDSAVSITRENQRQYISISSDVEGRALNEVQMDLQAALDNYNFPEGYSYKFSGTLDSMMDSYSSLMLVFVVAVLLVYMIMASQFESLIHPFIVLFSIPLAITGGIFGLFITGKTITMTAFMGFIMLAGMVVNNAIVLVDYTNQILDKKHCSVKEALIEAGPNRLRPILMTTLTTILGLVPMALGKGEGMEMQQPLAITVIFGLTISTIVTLIFIPILYSIVDTIRYKHYKSKRNKKYKQKHDTVEDIIEQST